MVSNDRGDSAANKAIGFIESLLGIVSTGIGVWSYTGIYRCPPKTGDCEGWAMLGAWMLVPPGILLLLAGLGQLKTGGWRFQIAALAALGWYTYWALQ